MTNKTETVSVPRELLERLTSATKVARGEGSPTQRDAEAILAAPAEDVRAVGEEPVYQVYNGVSGWIDVDLLRYTACQLDPEEYEARMLFVRPHRPVVLPERKPEPYKVSVGLIPYHEGWNVCIDEFKRLNK